MTKKRLALLGVAIFLVLAGLIAWSLIFQGPDPRIEALRKQGYPVSLAELDKAYLPVPDAENPALACVKAFEEPFFADTGSSGGAAIDADALPPRGQPFTDEGKKELADALAENSEALKLLHAVPVSSRSRYPVDLTTGFNTVMPYLGKLKKAASLLGAEAILEAAEGRTDNAVRSIQAGGRVADSLREEPLLISQLVRMASWAVVVSRLERAINLASFSDGQMTQLQATLADADRLQPMERALSGELASGLAVFTSRKDGIAAFNSGVPNQAAPAQSAQLNVALTALRITGLLAKDKAVYLQVMSTNLAAAGLPFPERLRTGKEAGSLATTLPTRLCIFSRMLLPALSRCFLSDAYCAARLRVAQAALGVERYRKAHAGALPASLQDLVPAQLVQVLTDPYDGKPLRFKRRDAGYVIYSLGRDEKDDGGLERNPKKSGNPFDITFIVEK